MNARMLSSLCALGLIPLVVGCCCDLAPHRQACGDGCRPGVARLAKGHVGGFGGGAGGGCRNGFPPYVPAPLGFMLQGEQHFTLTSISRHVDTDSEIDSEIDSSIVVPHAPAKLPPVAEENARPIGPDASVDAKPDDDAGSDAGSDDAGSSGNRVTPKSDGVTQPSHAPRATTPELTDGDNLEDAPSPGSSRQPVSVPADSPDADVSPSVPDNVLRDGGDSTSGDSTSGDSASGDSASEDKADAKLADDHALTEDAPEPKTRGDGGDDRGDGSDAGDKNDDNEGDWPEAPLPKNDLPSLEPAG